MLTLLLACSSSSSPDPDAAGLDDGTPQDGDTLVVAIPFDPGNLNPVVAPYALSGYYVAKTQLGLVERRVGPEGLYYVPGLAESWTWSEDKLDLTYTLKEGLLWSDGEPVSSADVAFTFELIFDQEVASNWFSARERIREVEVVDPRTVTFHFTSPSTEQHLMGNTHFGILPEHALRDADRGTLRGNAYSRAPLSSGPWVVTQWQPEERLVLEPNPNWSGPRPHLDRVITRVIPEYATQLIELENGGVDMLFEVQFQDVARLSEDPDISLVRSPAEGMVYVGWNTQDPVFEAVEMRRAMSLAIDTQKLIADQYTIGGEAYARPCTGTVGPDQGAWYEPGITPIGYDPAASMALMDGQGWTDSDGDGVRDKGGQPLVVNLMIQNNVPRVGSTAVRLQAMLKEVGVKLEILTQEPNLFAQRAREHDFQAMIWGFGNNPKVDPTIQWHSTGAYNWMQLSDPEIDALLEQAMSTGDLEEAQAKVREVQRRVYELQPATFLLWEDSVLAVHSRFQDVKTNTFDALQDLHTWWVPPSKQKYR